MTRYLLLAVVLAIPACSPAPAPSGADTAARLAATAPAEASETGDARAAVSGVVAETMNSGGYTYARLSGASGDTWMAAAEFAIIPGAAISAAVDMPMRNFHSRTLNREFTEIYFVRDVVMNGTPVAGAARGRPNGRRWPAVMVRPGPRAPPRRPRPSSPGSIPAPGGLTIADVWARHAALSGKPVVVRGQIVKVNLAIMGVNWYHVQDGSGVVADRTHDLVVTSAAEHQAGDVVTVQGVLATDKDFGAGYTYEAIIEGAEMRQEARPLPSTRR